MKGRGSGILWFEGGSLTGGGAGGLDEEGLDDFDLAADLAAVNLGPLPCSGKAYSSKSEDQYSAARAALVTSRRAKRLKKCPDDSGASHMLNGGAARTL